jgi:hypothetical protein
MYALSYYFLVDLFPSLLPLQWNVTCLKKYDKFNITLESNQTIYFRLLKLSEHSQVMWTPLASGLLFAKWEGWVREFLYFH